MAANSIFELYKVTTTLNLKNGPVVMSTQANLPLGATNLPNSAKLFNDIGNFRGNTRGQIDHNDLTFDWATAEFLANVYSQYDNDTDFYNQDQEFDIVTEINDDATGSSVSITYDRCTFQSYDLGEAADGAEARATVVVRVGDKTIS